jgi:hypothetical protein
VHRPEWITQNFRINFSFSYITWEQYVLEMRELGDIQAFCADKMGSMASYRFFEKKE